MKEFRRRNYIFDYLMKKWLWLMVAYMSKENVVRIIRILQIIIPNLRYRKILRYIQITLDRYIHPNCLRKVLTNLIFKSNFIEEYDALWKVPKVEEDKDFKKLDQIIINPTARCNLNCLGCVTGKYSKKDELDYHILDKIIREAEALGTYVFVISGGEPFLREDLYEIYETHSDAYFLVYTNGTLINKKVAKRLTELGNVTIGISIEGFEKETDSRRGKGVFKKAMKAMDYLKEEGIIFGFSVTVMKTNLKVVTSDKFINLMIKKGCTFGSYFYYFPIGMNPNHSLRPCGKDTFYFLEKFNYIRENKSILIEKFTEDAFSPAPCIFPARRFISITSNGDVEPCPYVPFAVDNIKNKNLKEILNSKFFKMCRDRWIYNKFKLNPCGVISDSKIFKKFISITGAYPTYPEADNVIVKLQGVINKDIEEFDKVFFKNN